MSKTACNVQLLLGQIFNQVVGPDGIRDTRCFFARETMKDLEDSIIPEFKKWLPENKKAGIKYTGGHSPKLHIDTKLPDGTRVKAECIFVQTSAAGAEDHFRSTNYTCGVCGEANLQRPHMFARMKERCGRHPQYGKDWTEKGNKNYLWGGMAFDFNVADTGNWVYKTFIEQSILDPKTKEVMSRVYMMPPPFTRKRGDHRTDEDMNDETSDTFFFRGWTYFPNPLSERLNYVPGGLAYYRREMASARDDFDIKTLVMAEWTPIRAGHAVYGESFSVEKHTTSLELFPRPTDQLIMAFDWGQKCAFTIARITSFGGVEFLDEGYNGAIGLESLLKKHLGPLLSGKYKENRDWILIFDPASKANSHTMEIDHEYVLNYLKREFDISPKFFKSANSWTHRYRCTSSLLNQGDNPKSKKLNNESDEVYSATAANIGLYIGGNCRTIKEGFMGAYKYKENSKGVVDRETPDKNGPEDEHSHTANCVEYTCVYAKNGTQTTDLSGRKLNKQRTSQSWSRRK